ncbi:hypothetical protein SD71_10745 [Cohnella kolymensis]|uniref:Portal protein n=1 Tax=Cohnella kolymensis TaxID=1590652 RepID=A0ABR5A5Z8_9BACL|nr:hypothetical protein [Cohnella kolymensis]KIL35862.1 hypothetical protein SD71_10745 [Cohnella kolymensis]
MADTTKDWDLYEAGKRYNNRLTPNYYDTVDANLAFFQGDQWRNLPDTNMPKPVFNIIKRVITFFVASMTTSNIKIHYKPLGYGNDLPMMEGIDPIEVANEQTKTLLEKFKMEYKQREALFDSAITGDACAHFYFDIEKRAYNGGQDVQGEICMEMVDGSNVFFGNANNSRIDKQPYIIVSGRDMVESLRDEAKRYKSKEQNGEITSDVDYGEQLGEAGRIEVEADDYGKAQYIIVYRYDKKTKTIKASKSVKTAYIYKDIDTELSHYPVAWLNWEKQKNQYHGRALCTGMLPNQIFINRMFAMVMYHLMMTAFPKAVYNADIIENWSNGIGDAIPVTGIGHEANIKNIAGYLEPGNMSNQIIQAIELAMQYTKETLGISDAAMGNVDPKNTSAIIAVQKSSAIPLENPKANLHEWFEDIGRIIFDMIGTYYGPRPVQVGEQVLPFDFSIFKDMWLDVKADVGEASYWSEIASVQTMDNLLKEGHLDIIDYLQRIPDEYIPQKQELIASIQQRMQQQAMMQEQQAMAQQEMANQPQDIDIQAALKQLSPEERKAFEQAPPDVKEQIIQKLLQQAPA